MAQSRHRLITKRDVLASALRIIDEEGLEGLSTRSLAASLNVSGPALYKHFAGKDEIVAGAVALALEDVRVPATDESDWREWLFHSSLLFREVLLAHPNLLPAISEHGISTVGLGRIEQAIGQMGQQGVPARTTLAIIDAIEAFAIGSALMEYRRLQLEDVVPALDDRYPRLASALKKPRLSPEEEFEVGLRALINGFGETLGTDSPRSRSRRRVRP